MIQTLDQITKEHFDTTFFRHLSRESQKQVIQIQRNQIKLAEYERKLEKGKRIVKMNWKALVKNLLDQLIVSEAIGNSFKNYHAVGLDYLCLFRSEKLTVKIYSIADTVQSANKRFEVLVNPHTHAYNFHTVLLEGSVENVVFKFSPNAMQPNGPKKIHEKFFQHNQWSYVSSHKDKDRSGFKFLSTGQLIEDKVEHLDKYGESCYNDVNDIHSYRTAAGKTTLLIFQYNDLPIDFTYFYNQEDKTPSEDGLYQKFNESEIVNMCNKLDFLCASSERSEL